LGSDDDSPAVDLNQKSGISKSNAINENFKSMHQGPQTGIMRKIEKLKLRIKN
jgi:hypothetical protein